MTSEDRIDPQALKKALGPSFFAGNILFYETIDSTNDSAKDLALKGAAEGLVIVADEQTAGRGRRGRTWESPSGSNLCMSVLLRPAMDPDQVFILTMVLAVVTAQVLRKRTRLSPRIKWPNDLFVGNRKLAGILTEFATRGKVLDYVILGMGLNVNWHPREGEETTRPATSVLAETGRRFSRQELLQAILMELDLAYRKASEGKVEEFYKEWNDLSLILGRAVTVESETEVLNGKALQIDGQGALIIEDKTGARKRILCGDVSLRFE